MAQAQQFIYKVSGTVVNRADARQPVLFAHGWYRTTKGLVQHFITNEHGEFSLRNANRIVDITIKADQYYTSTFLVQDSTELHLSLPRVLPSWAVLETNAEAEALVKRMRQRRNKNDAERQGDYSCQIYHKLSVRSDSLAAIKSLLNAGLRIFGQPLLDMKAPHHHLFLTETVADRYYDDKYRHKELITGLRLSGIEQFGGNLPLSQLTATNIYQDYVTIAGQDYVGPFAGNPLGRYQFAVVDTIPLPTDTLLVLKFFPRKYQQVQTLKGYLFIEQKSAAVKHAILLPAVSETDYNRLIQTYQQVDGSWALEHYEGSFFKPRAIGNVPVEVVQTGIVTGFKPLRTWPERTPDGHMLLHDGIVQEPITGASKRDSVFWIGKRPLALTPEESNTYKFYARTGSLRSVDKLLNLGERLYYGQLAYGNWALDLNKIISFNPYEGPRLGLGVTREWLSNNFTTSAYAGYGFQDMAWKWGIGGSWRLDSATTSLAGYNYSDDLSEPGQPRFYFDEPMYSSERLRKYLIPRWDREQRHEGWISTTPWPALSIRSGYAFRYIRPLYEYNFQRSATEQLTSISTQEWLIGLRWCPAERFIRVKQKLVSLGSVFPTFQLSFASGLPTLSGSRLAYTRLDGKVSYQFQKPGWGHTGMQLIAGQVNGDVPMSLLWTSRPSFSDASAVVTNSFETMRFNEFVLSTYGALFLNHDFAPFEIPGFPYYPYLSLSHNIGWGNLSNAGQHNMVSNRSMEHVYVESGAFLSDLFVVYLGGLRTGLGLGAFARYGAYARPGTWDNVVIKFAAKFGV